METYVTSDLGRVAHVGPPHHLACGAVMRSTFAVHDSPPPGRRVCVNCLRAKAKAESWAEHKRQVVAARDARIVALLAEGLTDQALRRRLGLQRRTVSRYVNEAMRRAGARTRFEWGYKTAQVRRP
jgi:DNA-binding CsgD family transcriptional regulator